MISLAPSLWRSDGAVLSEARPPATTACVEATTSAVGVSPIAAFSNLCIARGVVDVVVVVIIVVDDDNATTSAAAAAAADGVDGDGDTDVHVDTASATSAGDGAAAQAQFSVTASRRSAKLFTPLRRGDWNVCEGKDVGCVA